jgi:DNA-binding transcriptional LysR family regulator
MDLRRIRYFVVLAETLHFGRAALRLNIAQPPLSHQIRALEGELGAQLFERNNRRVELTPAGKALLPEARALLAQAERAGAVTARAQRGELCELRVGFTSSAALSSVIPQLIFAHRQRFRNVHLHLEELTTKEQITAMLERRLEVAFVRSSSYPDLPATLTATYVFEDSLVVALPPRHRFATPSLPLSAKVLCDEEFVMYRQNSGTGVYDQIIALCHHAGFSPRIAQEARETPTILGLVAAGLGVAFVPASLGSLNVAGVTYRPLRESGARSTIWLVLRAGKLSPQEEAFSELARTVQARTQDSPGSCG